MRVDPPGRVWGNPKTYLRSRQAMHPSISDLGDGRYFCAFDIGEAVEALDYRTYRVFSDDAGVSWSAPERLVPGETTRPSTHTIRVARCGDELIGFGSRAWRDDPDQGVLNRENLGYSPMELLLIRSGDGGRTFSEPAVITPPLVGPAFEICHTVLPLATGRWLAPTSTWRGWDGSLPNGEKGLMLISDDRGATWDRYGVSFDGTAEGVIHWEQGAVALADGRVLTVAWVYHPASGQHRPNRYAISADGGEHFTPSRELGIRGQTCKALALRDGRVLFAYRRVDRPGLWGQLGEVVGDDVRLGEPQPLWGTGVGSSGMTGQANRSDELSGLKFGFPQMIQEASGSVFLVFWGYQDDCTRIHSLRLHLD